METMAPLSPGASSPVLGGVILLGMTYRVGPKGQVVIPKSIRDRLGISTGIRDPGRADGLDAGESAGVSFARGSP